MDSKFCSNKATFVLATFFFASQFALLFTTLNASNAQRPVMGILLQAATSVPLIIGTMAIICFFIYKLLNKKHPFALFLNTAICIQAAMGILQSLMITALR